jgi:hypothetical protein
MKKVTTPVTTFYIKYIIYLINYLLKVLYIIVLFILIYKNIESPTPQLRQKSNPNYFYISS